MRPYRHRAVRRPTPLAWIATALLAHGAVYAAETDSNTESNDHTKYSIAELGVDYEVPESPAFTILGLNPENVTHASSPRDFAAQVLNGLDRNGNFQSGIAIDMNLWGILTRSGAMDSELLGGQIPVSAPGTNDGYIDGSFTPFQINDETRGWKNGKRLLRSLWYRTSFSFATTKGSQDDDKSLRLAAGARFVPWDPGDSRLQVGVCLKSKLVDLERVAKLVRANAKGAIATDGAPAVAVGQLRSVLESHRREACRITPECESTGTCERALTPSELTICKETKAFESDIGQIMPTDASEPAADMRPTDEEVMALLARVQSHLNIQCGAMGCAGADAKVVDESVKSAGRAAKATSSFRRWWERYLSEIKKHTETSVAAAATTPDAPSNGWPRIFALAKKVVSPGKPTIADQARDKVADLMVDECLAANQNKGNRSGWSISAAPSWISGDGTTQELRWNGAGVWTSLALGPDVLDALTPGKQVGPSADDPDADDLKRQGWFQTILHARYRFSEQQADNTKTQGMSGNPVPQSTDVPLFEQDGLLLGGRLRFLLTDDFGLSGEAAWVRTNVDGSTARSGKGDDSYWQLAVVPSIRVPGTTNMWLDVAFGTDAKRKNISDSAFVLSSIKYGLGQQPWTSHGTKP